VIQRSHGLIVSNESTLAWLKSRRASASARIGTVRLGIDASDVWRVLATVVLSPRRLRVASDIARARWSGVARRCRLTLDRGRLCLREKGFVREAFAGRSKGVSVPFVQTPAQIGLAIRGRGGFHLGASADEVDALGGPCAIVVADIKAGRERREQKKP